MDFAPQGNKRKKSWLIRQERGSIAVMVAALGTGLIGIFCLQVSLMYLVNKRRDSRRAAEFFAQASAMNYITSPGPGFNGFESSVPSALLQQISSNSPGAIPDGAPLYNGSPTRYTPIRQMNDTPSMFFRGDSREFEFSSPAALSNIRFGGFSLFPTLPASGKFSVPSWQTRIFYPIPVSIAIVLDQSANMQLRMAGSPGGLRTFDIAKQAAIDLLNLPVLEGRVNWSYVGFSYNNVVGRVLPITNLNNLIGPGALASLQAQTTRVRNAIRAADVQNALGTRIDVGIDTASGDLQQIPPDGERVGAKYMILISDGIAIGSNAGEATPRAYCENVINAQQATRAAANRANNRDISIISVYVEQIGKTCGDLGGTDTDRGQQVMQDIAFGIRNGNTLYNFWPRTGGTAILNQILNRIDPLNECVSDIPNASNGLRDVRFPTTSEQSLVFGYIASLDRQGREQAVVRVDNPNQLIPQGNWIRSYNSNSTIPHPTANGNGVQEMEKRFVISPASRRMIGNPSFCTEFLPFERRRLQQQAPLFRVRWGWPMPCSPTASGQGCRA